MQAVTNDAGEKGFYDETTGFVPATSMQKVTNPQGVRGYYLDSTGFVPAPPTASVPAEETVNSFFPNTGAQVATPSVKISPSAEWAAMDKRYDTFPRASSSARRLALEAGGATAGALLAAPVDIVTGNPAPSIAAGGLGYAAGKLAADYLDELAGDKQVPSFLERTAQTGKDFNIGALLQGGGEAASNAINFAYKWAKGLGKMGVVVSGEDILMRAKQILQTNTSKAPVNTSTAEKLAADIPGYKPSYAEMTADPDLIRLQQGLARQPGGMGVEVTHRQANREALSNYLKNNFPGGQTIDDAIAQINKNKAGIESLTGQAKAVANVKLSNLSSATPQSAGKGVFEKIKESMQPVLEEEKRLWSQVEDLPIPADNTAQAFDAALKTPSTAEPILKKINTIFKKTPRTVQGLRRVELEIDSAVNSQSATNTERHFLKQVKDGIRADIESLGTATDKGDIMMHGGEVIYPSKLQNDLTRLDTSIASIKSAPPPVDVMAASAALKAKGVPSNNYIRLKGETAAGFEDKIARAYKQHVGGEPPLKPNTSQEAISILEGKKKQIQDMLDNAQLPGNVAEQIKTAKNFSRDQKFGRFDRGAVRDILRRGNSPNNRMIPDANVAEKFLRPDNADQLIKALGSKQTAAESMDGFIAHNMESAAVNPTTGEIAPTAFNRWLSRNRIALDKYGLTGKYESISKAQATLEAAKQAEDAFGKTVAAKMLNADPAKAISAAMGGGGGVSAKNTGEIMRQLVNQMKGNPDAIRGLKIGFKDFIEQTSQNTADALTNGKIMSNTKIQDIINKYDPAMKVLYGEKSKEYMALRNVQKAIEVSYRSIPSPLGGGSNTAEQAVTAMDILSKVIGMPGLKMGPAGSFIVRAGQKALSVLNGMTGSEVTALLRRAMYDPELAKDLLLFRRGLSPSVVNKRLTAKLISMGLLEGKTTGEVTTK
ncbi:MAG: hypothetical protein NUV80_03735 [Candidatus Berkelbacteria bacterium]|nr:hypothetical protein [Candidatus Berkelbacteria bacterium]